MLRFISVIAGVTLAFVTNAAEAASYAATPVQRSASVRLIAPDISWACGPDACQGSTDESRPLVLCQELASRTGRIAAFLVNGRAFSATELDRCNVKAGGSTPLARAN